jgi:hypothetical protein
VNPALTAECACRDFRTTVGAGWVTDRPASVLATAHIEHPERLARKPPAAAQQDLTNGASSGLTLVFAVLTRR